MQYGTFKILEGGWVVLSWDSFASCLDTFRALSQVLGAYQQIKIIIMAWLKGSWFLMVVPEGLDRLR